MNAKEAYELSQSKDVVKKRSEEFLNSIMNSIKHSAMNGSTSISYSHVAYIDYEYISEELKKLGYKYEKNRYGIIIDWSEPK